MSKNKITFASIFLATVVVIFVVLQKEKTLTEFPPTPAIPARYVPLKETRQVQIIQAPRSEIVYTPEGKLDTSNWREYRSEYGGFSVRAPKEMASVGCFGHGCEPQRDGEPFHYTLIPNDGGGVIGISIGVIKKRDGTNIDNWISKYIVSGGSEIFAIQKTSFKNYEALQFDIHVKQKDTTVYVKYAVYPSGFENSRNIGGYNSISYRFFIVDLGNRYVMISHTLSIDSKVFLESLYDVGPLTPKFFDNKALADVYKAILDSFQAFTPTKI
ncbi:MAG: hypothetical protein A2937_03235 [Candidatus Yonathbacteria bacterium RIFCSPLOWO2_01_FULL_47_33b]|uniref:Uncharacterized protein n=1 Tax=Candidatus Yonathbacteria bacterium RIFCSPLOWO2_01_FULL_47_33b TaxID=1802727 RepID=A0A1G2SFX9_9BACT|nr:MAG: hypothetical protein A2937_03235 [Candidatus Yonathbacteria bacterium RIFCSPLOWO2_01_FULL_47_33b]